MSNKHMQGRTLFVKEYAAFIMKHEIMTSAIRSQDTIVSKLMNPTILPDELLKIVTPMIFIRHPAVVLPSWLRAANNGFQLGAHTVDDEDFSVWTSLRWSRIIFDYLRHISHEQHTSGLTRQDSAHSTNGRRYGPSIVATKPYVIDAADVLNNTDKTLEMICTLLDVKGQGESQTPASKKYYERAYQALKKGFSSNVMKAFQSNAKFQLDGQGEAILSVSDRIRPRKQLPLTISVATGRIHYQHRRRNAQMARRIRRRSRQRPPPQSLRRTPSLRIPAEVQTSRPTRDATQIYER